MSVSTLTQPSATVGPLSPGPLRRLAGDTGTMIARSLRLVSRDPDSIIMGIVLPVMLMVLFVHVFGGAMNVGGDYLSYVTPGIILLCAGFGAANTAIAVEHDMSSGIMDRFRSMPVASATVLTGHVIASVAKNLVTTAVVFGVAFLMGFRADAGLLEWLGAIGGDRPLRPRDHVGRDVRGRAGALARCSRRVHVLHAFPAVRVERVRSG